MYKLKHPKNTKNSVLAYPEGLVKLNSSASVIMTTIDNYKGIKRSTLMNIVSEKYPNQNVQQDVVHFIEYALQNEWIEESFSR
jgi:pyrroloquinoline quinone biosynthesis protein D